MLQGMQGIHSGLGTRRARLLPGLRNARSWLRLGIARFRWCGDISGMAVFLEKTVRGSWGFDVTTEEWPHQRTKELRENARPFVPPISPGATFRYPRQCLLA